LEELPTFLQRSCLFHTCSLDKLFPVRRKHLADISYRSRDITVLSVILLPWQQGPVVVEFVWHHSIARPRKLTTKRKNLLDLLDICCTRWVIAHFVSNFVAMATRVDHCKFCRTSFNSVNGIPC